MAGKALNIYGGRSDDHFQIRPSGQNQLDITQQKINIQTAFVRFINDQSVIAIKKAIMLNFRQQDTIGHEFDQC